MHTRLTATLAASIAATALAGDIEAPFRDLTFEQAAARAAEQDKAVMIDFFTTWCGPCKRLDAETWTDPSVRSWLEDRTIPLKLDAEIETQLADRYAVRGYPTVIFIDADGEEIERLIGFLPPQDFLEQAGLILDAGSTDELIARRKEIADESGAPARLEFVKLLMRHNRDAEAFDELVWCYDVGMGEGSVFRGSRNSRVLAEFSRLAERYAPAREDLDRRAVELLRKAARNQADERELHDLSALNAAIDREGRTLELIDLIEQRDPESPALETLYRANFSTLLAEKRYHALAARYPPRDELLATQQRWNRAERMISSQPNDKRDERRRDEARREIGSLASAYEIALGIDDQKLADALEQRILELAPKDWYTSHTLAGAIHRARGATDAALASSEAALRRLAFDPDADTVAPITRHARILHDAGRTSEAANLLNRALNEHADADHRDDLRETLEEISK